MKGSHWERKEKGRIPLVKERRDKETVRETGKKRKAGLSLMMSFAHRSKSDVLFILLYEIWIVRHIGKREIIVIEE
jgi:hypothetical protein